MNLETQHCIVAAFLHHETLTYTQLSHAASSYSIRLALVGDSTLKPLIAMKTSKFFFEGQECELFHSGNAIIGKIRDREFSPSDTFRLTEEGQNMLYLLKKDMKLLHLTEDSLSVAKEGTKYARLAFYAAVIFGLLSVMPDVKEKLWHWLQLLLGLSL